MPLDFPASPTNGQIYNNYVYDSTSGSWKVVSGDTGLGTRMSAVEVANATTNKSGLVPIIPTSITVSSGTASVSADGTISLNSGDAVLNGIFTSTYRNYKIIFNNNNFSGNGNPGSIYAMRFSSGGVTNSTSNYTYTTWYTQGGTSGALNGTGTATNWMWSGYGKDIVLEVMQPAISTTGTQFSFSGLYNQTLMIGQCGYNANASFDGIQFANNVYDAKVRVYGYN